MAPHFFNKHRNDLSEDDLSSQLSRLTSGDASNTTPPTSILSHSNSHGDADAPQEEGCGGVPGSTCKSRPYRPSDPSVSSHSSLSTGTGSLPHTDTMQSTSSSHSSSSNSGGASASKSSLGLSALVKGHRDHHHQQHGHSRKASLAPEPFILPRDPIALAEAATSSVLTVPGPPLEQLKNEIWPQLYHAVYEHRVNTREMNLTGLAEIVTMFRNRFQTSRVRFRSHLMDSDGTATMKRAAVALVYELIVVPLPPEGPGKHHHHMEEVRTSAMGVVKIYEGRLAQTDLVIDTMPIQKAKSQETTEIACTIM